MAIAPGTQIDRYRIISLLGAGGMGEVYLAEDARLSRKVAFKVLPEKFTADTARVRRFEQEARAASALNHPNIVTIHDIGIGDGVHFIAAEHIEGESLREHLRRGRPALAETLDIAIQAASALASAHGAGIVHRDVKPDNLMLRGDGVVKVLDFGLAKLAQPKASVVDSALPTLEKITTTPGTVMGTPQYMAPEQARGQEADARSDVFSLGVVLYELLAGRPPFEGATAIEVMSSILKSEPAPLGPSLGEAPDGVAREVERVVAKALRKDREQRYQSARELLADLRHVKEELAFTAHGGAAGGASPAAASSRRPVNRRALAVALILSLVAGAALFLSKREPILTDKDTILLAEFENKTGDPVFDGTMRQGLAVQLQQSPFLDLYGDQRVRAALRLMSRSPDDPVTRELGLQICQRQGLKAYLVGTIAKFERIYSITLEARNGQTGDSLAIVQNEAEGKDQVLRALSHAATELREKLGESLSQIRKFDASLEVTTSSLEALKEYALNRTAQNNGRYLEALEHARRATEIDPSFASAWLALSIQYNNTLQSGLASTCVEKAYALRDRAGEDERARITAIYYTYRTGELEKAIGAHEEYRHNYPRDHRGPGNLATVHALVGQVEKALDLDRVALQLNPSSAVWHGNLASYLVRLDRLAEAKDACQQATAKGLDSSSSIRETLHAVAFVTGDVQAQTEQIAWGAGRPDEHRMVDWQTQTAAFAGRWRQSQDFLRRARDLALRNEAQESAAGYTAAEALRAAWLGQSAQAAGLAEQALGIERSRDVRLRAALALALAGEAAKARILVSELEQEFPRATVVQQIWLPEIRAALLLREGGSPDHARAALDLLEPARRYERADRFQMTTLRAVASLKLGNGAEAATAARRILDHRGEAPLDVLWPLAHLHLARALRLQGDAALARKAYTGFFELWKEADTDLPVLIEAKKEYAALR